MSHESLPYIKAYAMLLSMLKSIVRYIFVSIVAVWFVYFGTQASAQQPSIQFVDYDWPREMQQTTHMQKVSWQWVRVFDRPDCSLYTQVVQAYSAVRWTGSCVNGRAEGAGMLYFTWEKVAFGHQIYSPTAPALLFAGMPKATVTVDRAPARVTRCVRLTGEPFIGDNMRAAVVDVSAAMDLRLEPVFLGLLYRGAREVWDNCPGLQKPPNASFFSKERIPKYDGIEVRLVQNGREVGIAYLGQNANRYGWYRAWNWPREAYLRQWWHTLNAERERLRAEGWDRFWNKLGWIILGIAALALAVPFWRALRWLAWAGRWFIKTLHYWFVPHPAQKVIDPALRTGGPLDGDALADALSPSPHQPFVFASENLKEKARSEKERLDKDADRQRRRYTDGR